MAQSHPTFKLKESPVTLELEDWSLLHPSVWGFVQELEQTHPTFKLKESPATLEEWRLLKSIFSNPPPDVADKSVSQRLLCLTAAVQVQTVHMSEETIVAPEMTGLFQLEPRGLPYLAEALVFGDWQTHPDPMARVTQLAKNMKYKREKDGIFNSKGEVDVPKARSIECFYPDPEQMKPLYDTALGRAMLDHARQQLEVVDVDLENFARDLNLNADEKTLLIARSKGKIKKRDAQTAWRTLYRKIVKARARGRLAAIMKQNSESRLVAAEPISDASLTVYSERVGGRSIWQHKGLNLD